MTFSPTNGRAMMNGMRTATTATGLAVALAAGLGAASCGKSRQATALRDDLGPLDASNVKAALARHRGKVVVLHFWATFCTPCEKELPELVAFASSPSGRDVALVTVATDEPDALPAVRAMARRAALPKPRYVLRAPRLKAFAEAAGIPFTGDLPATFFFDSRGRLAGHHLGALTRAELAKRIAAVRGKAP